MTEATKTKETKPAETKPDTIAIKEMNIFQRVAAITEELGVVAKNLSIKAGGNSYKAVSERDILDAVKPLEAKYRVYSFPSARLILESETLENEKNYNGNITKTTSFFTRMQTEYTFINIDKPEDRFTTTVFSEGIDSGDKGSGKGMTYADKYALMKAYKISTGDDPDQNPSEENRYTRSGNGYGNRGNQYQNQGQGQYQGNNRGYQGQGQNQYQGQNRNQAGPAYSCKNCGTLLQDIRRPDGSVATASEQAYYSSQSFGVVLCPTCQREAAAKRGGQAWRPEVNERRERHDDLRGRVQGVPG